MTQSLRPLPPTNKQKEEEEKEEDSEGERRWSWLHDLDSSNMIFCAPESYSQYWLDFVIVDSCSRFPLYVMIIMGYAAVTIMTCQ